MIPDDVIDQVREHADIVAIVGELVKLKRSGNSYRGPCPFHQGKDPNFSVSPRGGYMCFVCHEKGDVFTFVQKRLGMDFVDAVKYVGARSGIEVKEVTRARADAVDPRQRFWEMNAAAAEFFQRALWEEKHAAPARAHLDERRIARDVTERFGLGFAARDGEPLRAHLTSLGFDDATQLEGGLLVVRAEEQEPRPRFRNRLMFPIYDVQSRVIAFGGRVVGPGEPKYLNSPESPTFQKGSTLYGLNWARHAIRKAERVLLVEGYVDCLRLIANGIESTVAPLGTALTDAQAELLRRYTATVFLLYDSDRAGLKATFRAGDVLLRHGLKVHVVTLPDGEDPDTFVAGRGAAGLENQLEHAVDIFERKLQLLQRGGWFTDLRRKRMALDRLLPTIRAAADPISRGLYVARTAEMVGVARDVLERELRGSRDAASRPRGEPPAPAPADSGRSRQADRRREFAAVGSSAERELVRLLLHRRQYVEAVAERVGTENFRDPGLARIFGCLVAAPDDPVDVLVHALDDDAVAILNQLMASDRGIDVPLRIIDDCVAALHGRALGEELDLIDREMPLAADAEKDRLVRRKQQLIGEMNALGGGARRWKSFGRVRP